MPVETINQWPTFPRRNIAALARAGYLKNSAAAGFKRSISTLAKNGQLPTFRSTYADGDKQDQEEEESQEKRNMASIARLRSFSAMKRNIQALARDGYRVGRGQSNQQIDKRNIAALARNGLIHKREDPSGDEYFYPFYQNPIPPLSEIDGPFDINEIYDFQQSVNPDMFPPLAQVYKRSAYGPFEENFYEPQNAYYDNWSLKRGAVGLPVQGLYRPIAADPTVRTKRYILSMPDVIEGNDIEKIEQTDNDDKRSVGKFLPLVNLRAGIIQVKYLLASVTDDEARDNFEKRHIGSLARLGLLPSFRYSGGRYSRSGRARLLLPSQELYRSHRFQIRVCTYTVENDL